MEALPANALDGRVRLGRDIERKVTLGHMGVDRQDAPVTRYLPGASRGSEIRSSSAIGAVDLGIALVDALAASVQNLHRGKFTLEPFAEPQLDLRRRFMDHAADSGYRVVQKRVRGGERDENQC